MGDIDSADEGSPVIGHSSMELNRLQVSLNRTGHMVSGHGLKTGLILQHRKEDRFQGVQ